jgi:hypothetical protein
MTERDMKVMKEWLGYLGRAAEQKVRQRDPKAIRMALGIAKRQMKLPEKDARKGNTPMQEGDGFPIKIFSEAIREVEKRKG